MRKEFAAAGQGLSQNCSERWANNRNHSACLAISGAKIRSRIPLSSALGQNGRPIMVEAVPHFVAANSYKCRFEPRLAAIHCWRFQLCKSSFADHD